MKKEITKLKEFEFIHTVILFGSRAKGIGDEGSDFDICAVLTPGKELTLKERISLENSLPENVDLSLFQELPLNVRKRIFEEGEVLYSKDLYYFLTLGKETDFEYTRYKKFREEYHSSVMRKVAQRLAHAGR
jgi:predicted nucleotidyltransferase